MTRPRKRHTTALVTAFCLLGAVVLARPADASQPARYELDASIPSTDIGFVCGVGPGQVFFESQGTINVIQFNDSEGQPTKMILQYAIDHTVTGPAGEVVGIIRGPDILDAFDGTNATGRGIGLFANWRDETGSLGVQAGLATVTYDLSVGSVSVDPVAGNPPDDFSAICEAVI